MLKLEIGCALWLSRCLYEAHYDNHVNKFSKMFREGASIKFGSRNLAIPLEVSYEFLRASLGL